MQSKVLIFAITASLASAAKFGNSGFTGIAAGTPFEINWIDALGPVAIKLKSGPATALNDVAMIGSGLTGSSFSWTPSASLSAGLYALEIVDSTGPNYSVQFPISGSTSTTSVLSRTSVVTQLITPSPLATLSTLEFSSSSTSPTPTSSSDETEASAPTTLSTARASQTLAPTETESDTFEETTLRRTTSTGSQFTRTSSSPSSSTSALDSANSATKGNKVIIAAISTISGVIMFIAAVL